MQTEYSIRSLRSRGRALARKLGIQKTTPHFSHPSLNIKIPKSPLISAKIAGFIEQGTYERDEARSLKRGLAKGERVLELGGGIGFISTVVARDIPFEAYHLVEADSRLIPVIQETHRLNGVKNVTIHNAIMSSDPQQIEKGSVEFSIAYHFTASSAHRHSETRAKVSVPVLPWAKILAELKPTAVICDIEGSELDLFSRADLTGINKVFVELHPDVIGDAGVVAFFELMHRAGFVYDTRSSQTSQVLFRRI